jgi:AraC-like DNA-binding protein
MSDAPAYAEARHVTCEPPTVNAFSAVDRLARFREILLSEPAPAELYSERNDTGFWRQEQRGHLGAVSVTRVVGRDPCRHGLRRGPDLIRRSDPRGYRLSLYTHGPVMLVHNDRRTVLAPGDMALLDTSRPYDGWVESGTSGLITFGFAHELLPLPPDRVSPLLGTRLCGGTGIGALLWGLATRSAHELDGYTQADAVRVSTVLLDLVGGVLAHELEMSASLPPESRQEILAQRVRAFIERRLGDPDLTPATIAEAHHISLRTLHRLFAPYGYTVAEWIRTRRLARCRRDLADPLLAERPVHAVAARWGFQSPAHFSRLFRSAYGIGPLEYRLDHLRQNGTRRQADGTDRQ